MGRPRKVPMVARICKQCERDYSAPAYRNILFCSNDCYEKSFAPISYVCATCGSSFVREKRAERPPRRFCSRKCVLAGANPIRVRWEKARANGWTPKPMPVRDKCTVEGCDKPPFRIWHKKNNCWYGRKCADHRKQHRFSIYDKYSSERKYGPEFAPLHQANKQLRRMLKATKAK